jgi:hypothetical protein
MRMLISPIHYLRKQRARRKQLRTALHMLSASGVVRLGHIEPRYFEPPSHVDAFYRQGRKRYRPGSTAGANAVDKSGLDWMKLRQLVGTLRTSRPLRIAP